MSDTPRTDTLREVIVGQYKEDELTGDGMGNILSALPDIESLERERDEAREESAKWHQVAIDADKRFVEVLRERDEWKSKFIQQNKDLGCEMMDPGGTIWDYAKRIQLELNEAKSDLEFRRDLYKLQTERINAMQSYIYLNQGIKNESNR